MPGFELLDLTISLVFLFLLLSLFCSALSELVEAVINKRAANLLQGLKEMFNDQDGTGMVNKLYNQTMIFSLFKGEFDPNGVTTKNLPSYIPVENFSSALIRVLLSDSQGTDDITALKNSIAKIENEKVRNTLSEVVNQSCDTMEKATANIEFWYNSSMERVSGWYKKHVQVVGLILGSALAIVFNADAIGFSTQLTKDRAMTTAFVAVAQGYAQRPSSGNATQDFNALLDEVEKTPVQGGLPIGWNDRNIPHSAVDWLLKIIGWFLTAAATTLGAAFWFDMLKNLINIRAAVKPKDAT